MEWMTKVLYEYKNKYPFISKYKPYKYLWWEILRKWHNMCFKSGKESRKKSRLFRK
jgi:hypothetical protein